MNMVDKDSEEEINDPVHLDSILEKIGVFGRHQLITMMMLALVYATNSMYNINYVFVVEKVNYRCADQNKSNDIFQENYTSYYSLICNQIDFSKNNVNIKYKCYHWIYEDKNSFVSEFNLACQEGKQSLVGTAHSFGNMLGIIIQGQISDRYGRKTCAVFAGCAGAALGLLKSFASSYWMYVALECVEAALGDAMLPMFMLSIEILPKKYVILFQMLLLNFYTGGLIIMPFISWYLPYWRHFLRAIYAPSLLILTYSIFLDESVRWLFSKGKSEQAIRILQKIARSNNVQLDVNDLKKLTYEDDEPEVNDVKLLWKTFKSKVMRKRFLVCSVWWFTITLINYGMMISSVLIEGNKYLNFALLMLMDIPANVFYWLVSSKFKRKMPLIVSFLIGGVFSVTQPFITKEYSWVALILFLLFEMLATFSNNIANIYTSELFPTYTRNSMHALCSSVGRMGSLLAPQIPLLMTYWSGAPTLIFGITSLVSGALTIFMPETANLKLPDTVNQAERLREKNTLHKSDEALQKLKHDL